jgi:hypothetical protein
VSSSKFTKFKQAPLTFFFENIEESKALWKETYNDHGKAYLYSVDIPEDVYSQLQEVDDPDVEADIICNPSYSEMNSGLIGEYIKKAKSEGASGFLVVDMSQINPEYDAESIAIFGSKLASLHIADIKRYRPY